MSAVVLEALDADLDIVAAANVWAADYGDGGAAELRDILGQLTRVARPRPWGNYVARRADVPVGLCAFKASPADDAVEIAYGSFPAAQRQGVAQAMAAALVEIALAAGVATVVAHTLPEANASTRVLQRLGFAFGGTAVDPEDGEVWRWIKATDNRSSAS